MIEKQIEVRNEVISILRRIESKNCVKNSKDLEEFRKSYCNMFAAIDRLRTTFETLNEYDQFMLEDYHE